MILTRLLNDFELNKKEGYRSTSVIPGNNGMKYNQKFRNKTLSDLKSSKLNFAVTSTKTGVAISTLRAWYVKANPRAMVA